MFSNYFSVTGIFDGVHNLPRLLLSRDRNTLKEHLWWHQWIHQHVNTLKECALNLLSRREYIMSINSWNQQRSHPNHSSSTSTQEFLCPDICIHPNLQVLTDTSTSTRESMKASTLESLRNDALNLLSRMSTSWVSTREINNSHVRSNHICVDTCENQLLQR